MFDIEKIDVVVNQFIDVKQETSIENYWNDVAEVITQTLGFYFAGIYLSDSNNKFVVFKGGSGEAGKAFLKIGHKCKIVNGKNQSWHAGTAVYSNEIQLINWAKGEILGYQIMERKVVNRNFLAKIGKFWSPQLPLTQGELFIPIQTNHKIIGILEINLDVEPKFSEEEIVKLCSLADHIASISRGKLGVDNL